MSTVSLTYSRWGKSSYETQDDLAREQVQLREIINVKEPNSDADVVLIHSKLQVNDALLSQIPSVKLIITSTSGYEHIDLKLLRSHSIRAARMPLLRRDAVVESTLGMILEGTRKIGQFRRAAAQGQWLRSSLPVIRPILLSNLDVGVVGAGVIGSRVIEVLHTLGAKVWCSDPRGVPELCRTASLDDMVANCSVLTLHCDHNQSSHQIINRSVLQKARELILVNTARGKLVSFKDAIEALENRNLSYLGLDVFEQEPFPDLSYKHSMLCFTPHAAGYHPRLAERLRENLCKYVRQFTKGKRLRFEL